MQTSLGIGCIDSISSERNKVVVSCKKVGHARRGV